MKSLFATLTLLLTLAEPAMADVPRPESFEDTLELLAEALAARPDVARARIDAADQSVLMVLADGSEPITVFPDNIHKTLQGLPNDQERAEALTEFIDRFIGATLAARREISPELEKVLPVIRPNVLNANVGGEALVREPFLGKLSIFYVLDSPTSIAYLTEEDFAKFAIDMDALKTRAMENFAALEFELKIEGQGVYFLVFDGNYESSFLLDTDVWTQVEAQIGEIIAAAPARDLVVFTNPTWEGTEAALADMLDGYDVKFAYPLSDDVLRWTGAGWELKAN